MSLPLQIEYNERRKTYMSESSRLHNNHKACAELHATFYLWLADSIGIRRGDVPFTDEELLASRDDHYNDLALIRWDRMDAVVRGKAVRAGMRAWSLCDTVCVLKNWARRYATILAA